MLDAMTFGVGGAVIKIGGKTIGKTALKALKFEGIKPAIEVLKRVTGRVKVEVLKDAAIATKSGFTKGITEVLKKAGFQEHHIIPKMKEFSKHPLVERAGYDIESRANKMFLPSKGNMHPERALHRGAPNKMAKDRLLDELNKVWNKAETEGWSQQQCLDKLQKIVSGEKSGLRSGEFKLNKAE